MKDFSKLGIPFLIIFISALVMKLINIYLSGIVSGVLLKIITVIALCVFGATLNNGLKKRKGSSWKKVVSILIVVFLLFMQLNLFTFSSVSALFNIFGVDSFYINMLYIFSGYLFVD